MAFFDDRLAIFGQLKHKKKKKNMRLAKRQKTRTNRVGVARALFLIVDKFGQSLKATKRVCICVCLCVCI